MKECFREPVPKSKRCHNPKGLQQSEDLNFLPTFVQDLYILFTLHNKENCWHILHNIDK